jgi:uncharacterized membrane protein
MTLVSVLTCLNLLFAGLLAGEETAIRLGVRDPLGRLEPAVQIRVRQGLIVTLRVIVPILFGIALLTGTAATLLGGGGPRLWLRCAGLAALAAFIAVTLGGTVPINIAAFEWDPDAPPPEWRAMVARWEQLDTWRMATAVAAFALPLAAATLA